jgi:glycosyltransferase involved in cell wall biosynthesis
MKISVVIPCYDKHFLYLSKRMVELQTSTNKPDEVIISLNGCKNIDHKKIELLENRCKQIFTNFLIIKNEERVPRPEARNLTYDYITSDIICLCDADDRIHPQRIEITKYFFEKYNISHLLNSYILSECQKSNNCCLLCDSGKPNKFINYTNFDKIKALHPKDLFEINFGSDFIKPEVKTILGHNGKYQILPHHGNCAFTKEVFNKIKFDTKYPRGQDSLFCQQVLYTFKNSMLIDAELCIYENNWIPKKNDFHFFEKSNIYLNFGSQTYPGIPRREEEIKIIGEKI